MTAKVQAITLAQKAMSIQDMLHKNSAKIQAALPKQIPLEKMLSIVMNSIRRNPKIAECTSISVFDCVMTSAQLGIPPDDIRGLAYIIPFNNRKKGIMEAQLMPGYKGYIHLAKESGEVKNVRSRVVYENEPFEIEEGLDPILTHSPIQPSDRGKPKGAYTVIEFKDGRRDFTFMWEDDIQAIRKRSKASDSGPWVTDPDEMRKKTTIRRAMKTLDLSPEVNQAVAIDELFDTEKSVRNTEFEDGEMMVGELPGKPEVPEPKAIETKVVEPVIALSDSSKAEILELMNEMGWDFKKQEFELKKVETMGEKGFVSMIYKAYENFLAGKK